MVKTKKVTSKFFLFFVPDQLKTKQNKNKKDGFKNLVLSFK